MEEIGSKTDEARPSEPPGDRAMSGVEAAVSVEQNESRRELMAERPGREAVHDLVSDSVGGVQGNDLLFHAGSAGRLSLMSTQKANFLVSRKKIRSFN